MSCSPCIAHVFLCSPPQVWRWRSLAGSGTGAMRCMTTCSKSLWTQIGLLPLQRGPSCPSPKRTQIGLLPLLPLQRGPSCASPRRRYFYSFQGALNYKMAWAWNYKWAGKWCVKRPNLVSMFRTVCWVSDTIQELIGLLVVGCNSATKIRLENWT